jgi:hypothetical protein
MTTAAGRPTFPYRLVYIGIGLLILAAIIVGFVFGQSDEPDPLPAPIESLTPAPNDRTLTQTVLEIDLEPGYVAQVFVDGFPIPETELVFIESTGLHRWEPGPQSVVATAWSPGDHTIRIVWDTLAGLPSPGEFTWTFRVQ